MMKIMVNTNIKFVHTPKCAGSAISRYLNSYSNVTNMGHYKDISDKHLKSDSIWISNIRNPFEIYPSFWAYRSYGNDKSTVSYQYQPENCKCNSNDDLKVKKEAFKNWLNFMVDYESPGVKYKGGQLNFGIATEWVITYWFGLNKELFESEYLNDSEKKYVITDFIRQEHIGSDLKRILKLDTDVNIPYNNKGRETIDYRELYDQEMIDLVYNKDRYVFDKFKYDVREYFK